MIENLTTDSALMIDLDCAQLDEISGGEYMEKVAYGIGFLLGGLAGMGGYINDAIGYFS